MKDFNITKDFSVTILGSTKPLPKNVCYGRIKNVTYIMFPKSLKIEAYYGAYNRPVKKDSILDSIANLCSKHLPEWENLPAPEYCSFKTQKDQDTFHMNVRTMKKAQKDLEGILPHERKPQVYTPSNGCFSQKCVDGRTLTYAGNWEYNPEGYISGDDKKFGYNGLPVIDGGETVHYKHVSERGRQFTPVKTSIREKLYYGKNFEVGKNVSGDVAFLTKRDGLKALDKTHGQTEGKEKFKVALPEHSVQKRTRSESELREEAARLMADKSQRFATLGWKE